MKSDNIYTGLHGRVDFFDEFGGVLSLSVMELIDESFIECELFSKL